MLRLTPGPARLATPSARRCVASANGRRWASGAAFTPAMVSVNGRKYALPPASRPAVGICLDGSDQEYIDRAQAAGLMPNWSSVLSREQNRGQRSLVATAMPTLTNPNNVSIATGVEPKVHGIAGNYALDRHTKREYMLNEPEHLRCPTIFQKLQEAGALIGIVTAKDKLMRLLSAGLDPDQAFLVSVEKADGDISKNSLRRFGYDTMSDLMDGVAPPTIYDEDISTYGMSLAARWLRIVRPQKRPVVLYISTTDYVQHKHRPGTPAANRFYANVDSVLGDLDRSGAAVALTADHAMNDKIGYDGSPRVVYVETELSKAGIGSRVILPITDPYVVHHGALGSYATVYLDSQDQLGAALDVVRACDGVATALSRDRAAEAFGLPADAIGDIVICGDRDTVLGRTKEHHDLSQLGGVPLRSHGGMDESTVPFWINRPLKPAYAKKLGGGQARNFDLLDFLCNGIA